MNEPALDKYQWRLFRNQSDVGSAFLEASTQAKALAGEVDAKISESVEFAIHKYESWTAAGGTQQPMNVFLSPAVISVAVLPPLLRASARYDDAFAMSNLFGEMAKLLLATARQRYQPLFETFLVEACCALSDWWRQENAVTFDATLPNELSRVGQMLAATCTDRALSTYYDTKSHTFRRASRRDDALRERVLNDALARHFDQRLIHLLNNDRPKVKEYARTSMPAVYKMRLPARWDAKRKEWEQLLSDAGYEDVVRFLRDMGDLVSVAEIGQVPADRRSDVLRAAADNDTARVVELLGDSAKEIRAYLYRDAQDRLTYREPHLPSFPDAADRRLFASAQKLARTHDPDSLKRALTIVQGVWQTNINNFDVRDWVGYLQARTGNIPSAEQILDQLKRKRGAQRSFSTDWNLAVLEYERGQEGQAFSSLLPLLEDQALDEDLTIVVLALSLKHEDTRTFLETIPRSLSLRYHPLAITVAAQLDDAERLQDLIAQLFRHWQGGWELPSVRENLSNAKELEAIVNRAIVEGQVKQLIPWLQARIRSNKNWVPLYLELARVLEEETQDVEGAFRALKERCQLVRKHEPRDQRAIDESVREMFELCKRAKRPDLGQDAFALAISAEASEQLKRSFRHFGPTEPPPKPTGEGDAPRDSERDRLQVTRPAPTRDAAVPDRLVWVTARLAGIRNVASFMDNRSAIDELAKIVSDLSPQESGTTVELIRSLATVIETFSKTPPESRDARNILYARAADYETRLNQILQSGALSQRIGDVLTPFRQAMNLVVGDLSRVAGVGPALEVVAENDFISPTATKTTLVLRLGNKSERKVTDIRVEVLPEHALARVGGERTRTVESLAPQEMILLNVPLEVQQTQDAVAAVSFAVSTRASAEGFPDVDLGIKKLSIPVRRFTEVVGEERMPRLFQIGRPLRPSEPDLFQGRDEVLHQVRDSFSAGMQRERYFLDGIRRVGKTSILNFLPSNLPQSIVPVVVNMEKFGIQGPVKSSSILHGICLLAAQAAAYAGAKTLDVPTEGNFREAPGKVFEVFLGDFEAALPGRMPFLMIDEFQDLLKAIARTGPPGERDTLVLDQLRANLEEGRVNALFTGSVRFDRLTAILEHRIFGSLTRLRVSFLTQEGVGRVVRAGLEKWARVPETTVRHIYNLSGGYPWLTQIYGANLVDLLNREQRTVATPEDVDLVTRTSVVSSAELFEFWWPKEELGADEERFVETLLRRYPSRRRVAIKEFFSDLHVRDQATFRKAFENLRACEVLDSTQNEYLAFSGEVLRQWLEQQLQDGHLIFEGKVNRSDGIREATQAGIFIDHENLIRSLERISALRGIDAESDRLAWFESALRHLLDEAQARIGALNHKVAVAFWSRPNEGRLLPAYFGAGVTPAQPEFIKVENAVDFKVADEVRRAREQAMKERATLQRVIIVSGDGDLSHAVRALINDGVAVQVWGGSKATGSQYISIVGEHNFVAIDDVCGL